LTKVDVAELLRECHLRGWTLADLAKASGIHVDTLSRLRREGNCSPGVLRRILETLRDNPAVPGAERLLAREPA